MESKIISKDEVAANRQKAIRAEKIARGTLYASAGITIAILAVIITYIVVRGFVSVTTNEYPVIAKGQDRVRLSFDEERKISFVVHRGIRMVDLTIQDIYDLYSGETDNWGFITRQDIDVQVFALDSASAAGRLFQRTVMEDLEETAESTVQVAGEADLLERVARTPGAIGFVDAANLEQLDTKSVKVVEVRTIALLVGKEVMAIKNNRKLRFIEASEMTKIFRGRITNWKQVGGYDLLIRPVQFSPKTEIYRDFTRLILGKEDIGKSLVGAHTVRSNAELVVHLQNEPGAVGFGYYPDFYGSEEVDIVPIERTEVGPNLTLPFLYEAPKRAGRVGGISTIILNTLIMIVLTVLFATPIGVCAAIYLTEYARQGPVVRLIRFATETLAGIPSIIFGLFGFIFFVGFLNLGIGLISGTLTVTMMILPTLVRAAEESIKSVPDPYREGSLALGATKWQTITGVVVPAASPGILTGVILGVGRAVGETAAVLFTLGSSYRLVDSLTSSARVLSIHLYMLVKEGLSFERAFATATILMIIVLAVNFSTAHLVGRMNRMGENV